MSRSSSPVAPQPIRVTLSNGLTLVTRANPANPTVALQGMVRAGDAFDPPRLGGLAGFVGAMLDQGTDTRTALEQAAAVEDLGASLGFEGGLETLSISASLLSEDLDAVLAAAADALRNPTFPEPQLEKVRAEITAEIEIAENSTASVAARRANALLYPEEHPFHRHPGGSRESIRAIARDDLVSFHRRHYGPNNIVLVLVGDVSLDRARAATEAAFGDWSPLRRPRALTAPTAEGPTAPIRRVEPMPGKAQTDIVYAVPGIARTAPDWHAVMMMNYILGGASLSSRLMDHLRDRKGLVYGVYSHLIGGELAGPLQIHAGTNPENVGAAIDAILEEVRRLHGEGPGEEEMDEAKSYLTGVFPVRLETNTGVASQLLAAEVYGYGLDYIDRYGSIVRSITAADAREAARRYLNPDTYVLAIAGTVREPVGDSMPNATAAPQSATAEADA